MIYLEDNDVVLHCGDCLELIDSFEDDSVDAVVTSPPYLDTRSEYKGFDDWSELMSRLMRVCAGGCAINVGRIFRNNEEVLWWGDIIEAARDEGWLHQDTLCWVKPNGNPLGGGIVANSHEYIILFGRRSEDWNRDAVRTPYASESLKRFERKWINGTTVKGELFEKDGRTRNELGARPRSFVVIETGREKGNKHPAPMPVELAEYMVKLSSWEGGTVLDPFFGSGTTAVACRNLGRQCVGIESRDDYCEIAAGRLSQQSLLSE